MRKRDRSNFDALDASPRGPVEEAGEGWTAIIGPVPFSCLILTAILALTVLALRFEGRRWWCACATPRPWVADVWSSHCSQHLTDPYSITHVSHGLIFWGLLAWLLPRRPVAWRFTLAVALAAAWEIVENSTLIIERYRAATMSLNYLGDSVTNSLGDILSCALGFLLAQRLGLKLAVVLFITTELLLLLLIRDNLTLNVLMLLYPIDALRHWQSAAAPPL